MQWSVHQLESMKLKSNLENKKGIHVHIDADAFFASVEQALHRELKGKPVAVGQNGGIVTALSYPAKALGVSRVSPIVTLRKEFPQVKIAASDFNAYGIFSNRMGNIIKETFPNLVKNSVDEGSVDLTSYVDSFDQAEQLIKKLQIELEQKLGITFSFGIARTPLLAKLASSMNKPNGIEILDDNNVEDKIYSMPANLLSGIGKKGYLKLKKYGIYTIGDFTKADPEWLHRVFSVVLPSLQKQVLGEVVDLPKQKEGIKSMSRDRAFFRTESYKDLHSQMSMNIEHLSSRMRKEGLLTKRIGLVLRDINLNYESSFLTLSFPTRDPQFLLKKADELLKVLFKEGFIYNQISVSCSGLGNDPIQQDLFGEIKETESKSNVLDLIDNLEDKFGKTCINLASSMKAKDNVKKVFNRRVEGDIYPYEMLPGEEVGKRLQFPYLGEVG